MTDFGAFVELEPGLEGLVHVSEFRGGKAPKVGDGVKVEILNIDPEERKMGLGLKRMDTGSNPPRLTVPDREG